MYRFSNILFVVDSAVDASNGDAAVMKNQTAFTHALAVANNNQAKLTVMALVDAAAAPRQKAQSSAHELMHPVVAQQRERLAALVKEQTAGGAEIAIKVGVGKGFIEIIRDVLLHKRDLVIKSAEKAERFAQRLSFGSVDMKLLRQCPCPVWVTRPTPHQSPKKFLAAVDYDQDESHDDSLNPHILNIASSLALAEFAELHIVHAWRLPFESYLRSGHSGAAQVEVYSMLQQAEDKRRLWLQTMVDKHFGAQGEAASNFLEPQLHLKNGDADQVVSALANELGVDLIVMGTVGRVGIPGLLIGNTAEDILSQINSSVLAVKPAGFISPVTLKV